MKNSSIMDSNSTTNSEPAEISAEPEVMAKYRLGEWTTWHLAAYQDWAEEALFNLDITLINCIDVEGGGETALHIAARKNHYRFVKAVIKFHEVDMNIVDDRGFTPLHLAVQRGNEQTVSQLLLNNKTKLNYGGYEQPCPIHIAVANDQIGCVRMLLQAGANINAVYGKQGKRAIHIAARKGDEPLCRYLLSYSGDKKNPRPECLVNGVDMLGRTALHYAASGNHASICQMLIDFGARSNARDTNGRNALHLACEFGFRKTSVTLMENKCDREANDKYNMRPVEYALDKGHDGLVDIICEFE